MTIDYKKIIADGGAGMNAREKSIVTYIGILSQAFHDAAADTSDEAEAKEFTAYEQRVDAAYAMYTQGQRKEARDALQSIKSETREKADAFNRVAEKRFFGSFTQEGRKAALYKGLSRLSKGAIFWTALPDAP